MKTKLSGKSYAKGRNGYYRPAQVSTIYLSHSSEPFHVDIEGRRSAVSNAVAPIRFQLTVDDLDSLIGALQGLRQEAVSREA